MSSDMRKITAETARYAIDSLLEILNDARGYLISGDENAAFGTLLCFEEACDDLKAAMQLHRSLNRRKR